MDNFSFKNVNTSLKWLEKNTIFLTKHGSHAYGLNTPTSDYDVKGIAVPPKDFLFGMKTFEQQITQNDEFDLAIFDIKKFFKLAIDCNPSVIEVIFTDEADHLISSDVAKTILENRDMFLSKKAKFTFSGYAISQLKRITTHRRWILNPVEKKPERADFDLPELPTINKSQRDAIEFLIRQKLESYGLGEVEIDEVWRAKLIEAMENLQTDMMNVYGHSEKRDVALRTISNDDNFVELINRENLYKTKLTEYHQYQEWKEKRNKSRFELEEKFGYDTKHAMHLMRLLKMCREIMLEKTVKVKRIDDREYFLAIRRGIYGYDELVDEAKKQEEELNDLYEQSNLPHSPDRDKVENVLMKCYEEFYRSRA